MLVRSRVLRALDERRDAFRQSAERAESIAIRYRAAFSRLADLDREEIEARLEGEDWPGARPLEPLDDGPIRRFGRTFPHAEAARAWALERIRGVTTLAVDGSQIPASREFAVPVSLVQVAWFENPHDPDGRYVKDVRDEILTTDGDEVDAYVDGRVGQRRFGMEMAATVDRIPSLPVDPPSVVFIDGSLVLSFVTRFIPPAREAYLAALRQMLAASRGAGIPVTGYVDRSYARDLVRMTRLLFDLPDGPVIDSAMLHALGPLDRTIAFECARGDVLPLYGEEWSRGLAFVYLATGVDTPPARLDIPRWVVEKGLLDHVVDVARAEIIAGPGYPYALEAADSAAVLTNRDRIAFFELFRAYTEENGLMGGMPRKAASKAQRR